MWLTLTRLFRPRNMSSMFPVEWKLGILDIGDFDAKLVRIGIQSVLQHTLNRAAPPPTVKMFFCLRFALICMWCFTWLTLEIDWRMSGSLYCQMSVYDRLSSRKHFNIYDFLLRLFCLRNSQLKHYGFFFFIILVNRLNRWQRHTSNHSLFMALKSQFDILMILQHQSIVYFFSLLHGNEVIEIIRVP